MILPGKTTLAAGVCKGADEQGALPAVTVWPSGIHSPVPAQLCSSLPLWEGWLPKQITQILVSLLAEEERLLALPPPKWATCSEMGRKSPCVWQGSTWRNSLGQLLTCACCGWGITHFHCNNCLMHELSAQLQATCVLPEPGPVTRAAPARWEDRLGMFQMKQSLLVQRGLHVRVRGKGEKQQHPSS